MLSEKNVSNNFNGRKKAGLGQITGIYSLKYRTSRLVFEVRKPSRSGSKETGETDLGRVLPMNLRVYSRLSTLE